MKKVVKIKNKIDGESYIKKWGIPIVKDRVGKAFVTFYCNPSKENYAEKAIEKQKDNQDSFNH